MQLINCEASEIWNVFQSKKEQLKTKMEVIAECPELGVVIYLTAEERGSQTSGKTTVIPNILVFVDGTELYEEVAVGESDCEDTVKRIYYEYLTEERLISKVIDSDTSKDKAEVEAEAEAEDQQQEIDDREEVIDNALYDFLTEILVDPLEMIVGQSEAEDIYEDVKEHLLEYLYRKWDLDIYRPMYLEFEDGEESFEEYPYGLLEFDDPDNPLYK